MSKRVSKSVHKLDGLQVYDTDEPIEFELTEQDISRGKKKDPLKCGFAIALQREFDAKQVRVNPSRTYVEHNGVYLRYFTPVGVKEQIELFDRTGKMGPGVYTVKPMPPALRFGATDNYRPNHKVPNVYIPRTPRTARPIYKDEEDK